MVSDEEEVVGDQNSISSHSFTPLVVWHSSGRRKVRGVFSGLYVKRTRNEKELAQLDKL